MKTSKTFLASLIILLSTTTIFAQYGNGYNNGYGNGYGRGGRMNQMAGMNQNSEPQKPKEIPAEVTVGNFMEKLKPALKLDELQTIAISNILIENVNAQGRILKLSLPPEDQYKEFQSLTENTERKLNNYLNAEQKEKYIIFKEESKNPKKSKSKDKKK